MRTAYFDCFSGASGDMILGACLDAGASQEALCSALAGLDVQGWQLRAGKVRKQGFAATQVDVVLDPAAPKPHRHLKHIREIIQNSRLADRIKEQSLAIFNRLAEAEAAAHGCEIEKVHFHEVGALDAIVDVTGACIALNELGVGDVICSPIPTGFGTITCEHGVMPIPAPGTAALLKNVPIAASDEPAELTTPTGAAILTTLASQYGPLPDFVIERIGYGAGRRDGQTRPNLLRLYIGQTEKTNSRDEIVVLEANLDDLSPEAIGYATEKLLSAGALDVTCTPVYMKKNRPGTMIMVLAEPERQREFEDILFMETSTFGVRAYRSRRCILQRSFVEVQTEFGPIRIKIGERDGIRVTASPEFEDCRRAAENSSKALREIMNTAMQAYWIQQGS